MIAIRTDGNKEIATGHIMRCMAIASEIKKHEQVLFILADKNPISLLKANDFDFISLDTDFKNMDAEINLLKNIILKLKISSILIDSYFATEIYFSELSLLCKTAYIDDIGNLQHGMNTLINYNIYAHKLGYERFYANTGTALLLGCGYAPLRSEFMNIKPVFRHKVTKILITTGGADNFNVAGKLLDRIVLEQKFTDMEFHIIIGSMNRNVDHLKKLAALNNNVILYQNIAKMSYVMLKCDAAVTACGTTVYELCACGLPSVCFTIADNQMLAAEQLKNDGLMLYAGDFRINENNCLGNIIDLLSTLIDGNEKRYAFYKKITALLDGKGAVKIADELRKQYI